MRIYTLQIHINTNGELFDEVYHFSNFENCVKEFKNKFKYYNNKCAELLVEELPELVDGEAYGMFKFQADDEKHSIVCGRVYDYDILDEDD